MVQFCPSTIPDRRLQMCRPHREQRGFTLLEVMLSVGLLSILIAGIFATQRGALTIARSVTEQQEISMRINSFVSLLQRNFEQSPGNCRVNLILSRDGGSEVYFKDYPLAFAWSGVSAGSKGVILRTEKSTMKMFNAVVLYLDEEATKDYEAGHLDEKAVDRSTGMPRVRRLELMEGISELTWQVIDDTLNPTASGPNASAQEEWLDDWPLDKTKRPSRVRMKLMLADSAEPMTLIFWIPVMANPQQFANVGGATGSPSAGGGGGEGANPPGGGGGRGPGGDRPPGGGGGNRPPGGGGGGNRPPGGGGGRPGR